MLPIRAVSLVATGALILMLFAFPLSAWSQTSAQTADDKETATAATAPEPSTGSPVQQDNKNFPNEARVMHNEALKLKKSGDYAGAEAKIREAIKLAPEAVPPHV